MLKQSYNLVTAVSGVTQMVARDIYLNDSYAPLLLSKYLANGRLQILSNPSNLSTDGITLLAANLLKIHIVFIFSGNVILIL
jgi:hypothetical protein